MRKLFTAIACVFVLFSLMLQTGTYTAKAATGKSLLSYHKVCNNTAPGSVNCSVIQVDRNSQGVTPNAAVPSGLTPADLQSAYNLPSADAGYGQTIAIAAGYDDPHAESDLSAYRAHFGLPPCTSENGCFKQVNTKGEEDNYPPGNVAWAEQTTLDLDMVSAVCPNCHILLVEGEPLVFASLVGITYATAKLGGADIILNDYGTYEFSGDQIYAYAYNHPGILMVAPSGRSSYNFSVPAAFNTVVAVGSTTLKRNNSERGWSESAWGGTTYGTGSGSGCSKYIAKPAWQTDSGCSNRAVADVSAVGDPKTGVAIFDTYGGINGGGWLTVGGASAAIVAGVYGLAGNAKDLNAAQSLYENTDQLNDITTGNNGSYPAGPCYDGTNPMYLCQAGPGYDGPTGNGTPNGIGAF